MTVPQCAGNGRNLVCPPLPVHELKPKQVVWVKYQYHPHWPAMVSLSLSVAHMLAAIVAGIESEHTNKEV